MKLRRRVFAVLGLSILLGAHAPAHSLDRLSTMWRHQGPLVFAAAASTTDVLRPLSEEILGPDWVSWAFDDLVGRLDPAALEQGFGRLSAALNSLPADDGATAVYDMEPWIACYRALEAIVYLIGPETFGTAVAMTPAVAADFPRDAELIKKLGADAGSSLASSENSELMYKVATRLSRMEETDTATTIRDLWVAAVENSEGRLQRSRK